MAYFKSLQIKCYKKKTNKTKRINKNAGIK